MKTLRKALVLALCAIAGLGVVVPVVLDTYYFGTLPRQPDLVSGRVHRITVSHGSIRYGTAKEQKRLAYALILFYVGFGCGLAGGLLHFYNRRQADGNQ